MVKAAGFSSLAIMKFSPMLGQKRLKFKFNDDVNAVGYGK